MKALVPVLFLIAGALAGRYLFPAVPGGSSVAPTVPAQAQGKPSAAPPLTGKTETAAPGIHTILNDPIAANRRQSLYKTLAGLTKDNWQPVYDAFMQRRKEGRHDGAEWELFLNALGAVDGRRGMERLMADFSPDMNTSPWPDYHYILRSWVPANKDEAMAWQSSLPKGPFRDGLWSGVIGGLAEVDANAAIAEVEKLDPGNRRYFLYDLAPRIFQQGGLAGGEAWLNTVVEAGKGNPASRSHVTQVFTIVSDKTVEGHVANARPLDAVNWLAKHRDQPYWPGEQAWGTAVRESLKANPQQALNHFTSLQGRVRDETLKTGLTEWAKTDSASAERWLAAKQDEPWYDSAAKGLIGHLLQSKPAEAQKWIDSLADPATREAYKARLPR